MKNYLLFRAWASYVLPSLLYFLVLCYAPNSSAQNAPITGTVADALGILPGVTIQIKNKSTTTTTDANGAFQITAALEDTLVFSYIGYLKVEVVVGTQTHLNILLKEDATALEEVLVNAGYYKVKDKERTGSIAKITAKDIENQPVTNVLATMQGRMAGVNITQTTGVPGGGFDIQIRGLNSVRTNGNDPLYLINGVPYSSAAIGSGLASAGLLPRPANPLNSIPPDQIESIEILKDADATAIYGSRGANGVVLITTKTGKSGQTTFDVSLSTGFGTVPRFIKLLNTAQYLEMREEAFANDGFTTLPASAYDVNGTWDRDRYTDWEEVFLGGTSERTSVTASVSGGSEQTQYRAGASFNKETSVFPGDFSYKKAAFTLSAHNVSENKKWESTFTTGYTVQDNVQPRGDLSTVARTLAPNAPALYNPDGSLNWENSTWSNPLRNLEGGYTATIYDLLANAFLSYQLTPQLALKSSIGYTKTDNLEVAAVPSTQYDPASGVGPDKSFLKKDSSLRSSWIVEPQIQYRNQWGQLRMDALVGSTFQSRSGQQFGMTGFGFSSNSLLYNMSSASTKTINIDTEDTYRYAAIFGRINLNWNEKYILNVTGRRDGSSRFGPGKQFANFGALGAAWIFSNEPLFKNQSLLSFGKLRGSYGSTGSDQIGDYQFLDSYVSTGNDYGGVIGLEPARLYNPNFGWESSQKSEVALELGFWNDRIFLTAGYYNNRSSSQLAGMPLPGTTGFASLQTNLAATVQNTGTELTLRTVNFDHKDFSWSSSLNVTFAQNKLLSFPDLASSTYQNMYVIGESLNIKKVYEFTGVDPTTGLYTFKDYNGDGLITAEEDRKKVKDFNPSYYGGLHNSVRYKQFQLDFLFQFVKQQNYTATAYFAPAGIQFQQPVSALNHWQQEGDSAPHQLYTTGANSAAMNAVSKYMDSNAVIGDASYVRLKNLSISYRLPNMLTKRFQCKLFLEGQNLLTFTNYEGADPEFKSAGFLPPLRVISGGFQLTL
ncbi:SusC/RagA family TonB-linked outer membrane protein [Flavobacterium sp. SM2513]|uniref:SusC/RagA family TonB-linked outer membrane protein n=1 Tax=Flavobacterium sp. SM2513 TaxID=3424766 RepID=UPI003D7FD4E3